MDESEERLRLALSPGQQGIYDLNVQTGNAVVNDIYATKLGYDPETFEETNAKWIKRLHPDDRELAAQVFRDYVVGKLPDYRVEFRQRTVSGDWKWILSLGKIVEYDQHGQPLRMLGTHTDITETKMAALRIEHLLKESQRRLQRIEMVHHIDTAIRSNDNLGMTLNLLLEQVKHQLAVDAVAVLLWDEAREIYQSVASLGFPSNLLLDGQIAVNHPWAGKVAQEGAVIHIWKEDAFRNPAAVDFLDEEGFWEYYGIPLNAKGRVIGILELFHRTVLDPDAEWLSFSETLAGQATVAIENAQLVASLQYANEELIRAYDATIEGWSMAMDLRNKETEGHTQRVTAMTVTLAKKNGGVAEADIIHFRHGALLHDIGKMAFPIQLSSNQES